jgi:heme-degrading monooxygenase HmoA
MTRPTQHSNSSVFRIDSFAVPEASRVTFMAKVQETKEFLDKQSGCLQNLILQQHSGSDRFNVVTVVEWEHPDAFANAKVAMMEQRRGNGFDPEAFLKTLGIEANMSNYIAVS